MAVLKAAKLRFPENADIQTYSHVLLSQMALKMSEKEPTTSADDLEALERAAMAHARRIASAEEQVEYLQVRVQALQGASGHNAKRSAQKDDDARPPALVQQHFAAEEASQVRD